MKIALTVDPEIPVPPKLYGGIERIVDLLAWGLSDRGHEVTLLAHPESDTAGRLLPYPGRRSQKLWDTLRNTAHVGRLAFDPPNVVHSFGRLAYLTPLLPLSVPKIMSYQRHVTTSRVRWAHKLARADSLLFTGCSDHITGEIRPHAPARTVYNGVPLETYDYEPSVEADAPLVFLGRIAKIKGTHRAVEVARQSGRRLLIAGNVPDEEADYFEQHVRPHLNGSQIRHVGPVNDEKKNQLLGRASALLMPIEWDEPFGIVMAEAMACGTPVIGNRRGSIPEVVEQGTTGFVCDNTQEMVEAVGRIDELSREACRKRCEEHFSDRAIVDAYESLYKQHAKI
ncbi:glycosyltransferase involved in cell wall biosynthesis [Salinibacter ruber]|uniref:glycosyltransferase family 4 protein n=1 Tax=Salinibacter ruber TaxID=146919 RepID=UPI0021687267|nr:glycosyltransferase family 4 protein [Salinibacter ruber]MCS3628951.1 glycosyltransferase involved in cell wall biosynthesis [Salinibacter ruber]MCS4145860.1 glycosyltransferase involved in cell wall biosynthesis [Salinibacter ruber]